MKKTTLFCLLCLPFITESFAQTGPKPFILKGNIKNRTRGKLALAYPGSRGNTINDTAVINNGSFVFKGMLTQPCEAYLSGNVASQSIDDPNFTSFFIEPGTINVTITAGDFKHAVITGSKTQNEAKQLEENKAQLHKTIAPLQQAYMQVGEEYRQAITDKKPQTIIDSLNEASAAIHDKLDAFAPQFEAIDYAFFTSHPSSYVTVANLRFYTGRLTLDSLRMFYNGMNSAVQQSVYGLELAKQIKQLAGGSPGAIAQNFTANSLLGNSISLSTFKGKYVLLDFWASWCVPCRHSNPHLKELYEKYHGKGLEIIGVSDDDGNETDWRKAVDKDGIAIWHHVLRGYRSDKPALNNDINDKYGVHSLPTKILIDKNGVIIGRYDKGTEEEQAVMDKMIAEAMGG